MKLHYSAALTSAFVLAFAGSPALATDVSPEVRSARMESQIWTTYALSPYLHANDLKVTVADDTATLTGVVADEVNKELAYEIAMGVPGVSSVDNQIDIRQDYVPPAPDTTRTYRELVEDASITTAVKSKLLWSKYAQGLDTTVDTERGAVTLSGTASSREARGLAQSLAYNTRGVVSVDNQLKLQTTAPGSTIEETGLVEGVGQDITDTWITAKIMSTFLYSSNVNSSNISVDTTDGNVTLTGKVGSGAERALAIELAEHIRGVKSVSASTLEI